MSNSAIRVAAGVGGYAIHDPHNPWRITYWRVHVDHSLDPWPSDTTTYGPQPAALDGLDDDARRAVRRDHRAAVRAYRQRVADLIGADPATAASLFQVMTARCCSCRKFIDPAAVPATLDDAQVTVDPAEALARSALRHADGDPVQAARLLAAASTRTLAHAQVSAL